jgi:hypothetical protein
LALSDYIDRIVDGRGLRQRVITQPRPIPEVDVCATTRLIVPNSDRCKISTSFGGSDASRVNTSVRGEVVDLAARDTDIH